MSLSVRLSSTFMAELSQKITICVGAPSLLFGARRKVSFDSMSILELITELDARGWTRIATPLGPLTQRKRQIAPFVSDEGPYVWYCSSDKNPFKEYLLCLLDANQLEVPQVYHLQCKSYYRCLLNTDLKKQGQVLQPHQTAQFYRALTRRREKLDQGGGGGGGSDHEDAVQLKVPSSSADMEVARGPNLSRRSRRHDKRPAALMEIHSSDSEKLGGDGLAANAPKSKSQKKNKDGEGDAGDGWFGHGRSSESDLSNDSESDSDETEDGDGNDDEVCGNSPVLAPAEAQAESFKGVSVAVEAEAASPPADVRHPGPDAEAAMLTVSDSDHEVAVADVQDLQPAVPMPSHEHEPAVDSARDEGPVHFNPTVNSAGHRSICDYILPEPWLRLEFGRMDLKCAIIVMSPMSASRPPGNEMMWSVD